jgi:hypothetical protein
MSTKYQISKDPVIANYMKRSVLGDLEYKCYQAVKLEKTHGNLAQKNALLALAAGIRVSVGDTATPCHGIEGFPETAKAAGQITKAELIAILYPENETSQEGEV